MDFITLGTNALIAVTLIYCVILERRIRQFRKQETIFKTLISELSRSTMAAQAAAADLRRALNDAQNHQKPIMPSAPEPLVALRASEPQKDLSQQQMPRLPSAMTAADLARHFADLRLSGARS